MRAEEDEPRPPWGAGHVYEPRWFPLRAEGERAGDLIASWPSLRITVELGVWHWPIRPRVYLDDLTWTGFVRWLGLSVELYGPDRRRAGRRVRGRS